MDLLLHFGDTESDVRVRVEPRHTIGQLTSALQAFASSDVLDPADTSALYVNGEKRAPEAEVGQVGLTTGASLSTFAAPTGPVASFTHELVSLDLAGEAIPLTPGVHEVSVEPDGNVAISPRSSRDHPATVVATIEVDDGHHGRLTTWAGDTRVVLTVRVPDRLRLKGRLVPPHEPIDLADHDVIRLDQTCFQLVARSPSPLGPPDPFGLVAFHRTPDFRPGIDATVVEAPTLIPREPEAQRFALLTTITPLLAGLSTAVVFGSFRYLLFATLSPVVAAVNRFEQGRRGRNRYGEAKREFEDLLRERQSALADALDREWYQRTAEAPSVVTLVRQALARSRELWSRHRSSIGFLELRLGLGDRPSSVTVSTPPTDGEPELMVKLSEALSSAGTARDAPITIDLTERGALAVTAGAPATRSGLVASLLVQTACLHSPEDVVICAAVRSDDSIHQWLKWLPHTRSASSPLPGAHLAGSGPDGDRLLTDLIAEGNRRRATEGVDDARFPWLLVVLDKRLQLDPERLSRLLDLAPGAGISVIWSTDTADRVPRQIQANVNCDGIIPSAVLRHADRAAKDAAVSIETVAPSVATTAARALAPLRDASSASATTALPAIVPLFDALHLEPGTDGTEPLDAGFVTRRWAAARLSEQPSLEAPIGFREGGRALVIDLVEDGPHGLIGGTSGSGKSELLMSMVLGLMVYNPPDHLAFLFVDYKGGAFSAPFASMAHTIGQVTNLNAMRARRALLWLRVELNQRMRTVNEAKARDLAELRRTAPESAPPSLVIVIDEFATIAREVDGFVDEIVDIAQRGRSLGIHLIMATQRPAGAINENIKANTNLRISLRMLDTGDSSAVIGVPDAARLPAPLKGRGYVSLGPGQLISFQSAWAGAPEPGGGREPEIQIEPFDPVGDNSAQRSLLPVDEVAAAPRRTQLDAALDHLATAVEAERGHGRDGQRPRWHEELQPVVPLDLVRTLAPASGAPGAQVRIGLLDDAERRHQGPAVLDLAESGGMLAVGAGASGKSALLKVVAASAVLDADDDEGGQLTIFGLDFASRSLLSLRRLPHCSTVADGNDWEAVIRVLQLLFVRFEDRRRQRGHASAAGLPEPLFTPVLLLIDGVDSMFQAMDALPGSAGAYGDMAVQLIANGREVAMYPVMTASREAGVRRAVLSAVADRIVLRQADPEGYHTAGLSASEARGLRLGPGRGFLNGPVSIQVAALLPEGEDVSATGDDLDLDLRDEIARLETVYIDELAARGGSFDPEFETKPLDARIPLLEAADPARLLIGRADLTDAAVELDLTFDDVAVCGDPRSGRSTTLATIGYQAHRAGRTVVAIASARSPLAGVAGPPPWPVLDPEQGDALEAGLNAAFEAAAPDPAPLLLVDDADEVFDHVGGPAERTFIAALRRCRFVGAFYRPPSGYSALQSILRRRCRTIVLLQPESHLDARNLLGSSVPPQHVGLANVPGRGYLRQKGMCQVIQVSDYTLTPAREPDAS